jgi:putative transposase
VSGFSRTRRPEYVVSGFSRTRRPEYCLLRAMLTGRPPRLKHFTYTGYYRYSLTFCSDQRRAIFRNHRPVDVVLSQISRASKERDFAVIAYCFMPDHLHLLVHGQSESADCKRFITIVKQYSAYYYSKEIGGKLWQRYGYERVLRKDEETCTVARYILENPVRAGLVACVEDYPFLGSLVCDRRDLLLSLPHVSG